MDRRTKEEVNWESAVIINPETIEDRRLITPGDVSDLTPKTTPDDIDGKWMELAEKMMAGEANSLNLFPKVGVDPYRAFRHLRAIIKGTNPHQVHRTNAVAYLLSLWYDDYTLPEISQGGWSTQ
jgi:hypothetical protein